MLEMEFSIQKRNYKLFSKKALPKPMGLRQALNKQSASKGCKGAPCLRLLQESIGALKVTRDWQRLKINASYMF